MFNYERTPPYMLLFSLKVTGSTISPSVRSPTMSFVDVTTDCNQQEMITALPTCNIEKHRTAPEKRGRDKTDKLNVIWFMAKSTLTVTHMWHSTLNLFISYNMHKNYC